MLNALLLYNFIHITLKLRKIRFIKPINIILIQILSIFNGLKRTHFCNTKLIKNFHINYSISVKFSLNPFLVVVKEKLRINLSNRNLQLSQCSYQVFGCLVFQGPVDTENEPRWFCHLTKVTLRAGWTLTPFSLRRALLHVKTF